MTAALPRILDHANQGVGLLIDQYRRKPLIEAWARAYLNQVQAFENAAWDVIVARFLDSAVGHQLDVIGRIVGELRRDRVDIVYRVFIKARIRINRSKGNTKDVLDVLGIITTTPLFFKEYLPACLYVELQQIADEDEVLLYGQLKDTKAGGVKLVLVVPTTDTHAFAPSSAGAYNGSGTDGQSTVFASGSATFTSASANFPVGGLAGATITISGAADAWNNGTFPVFNASGSTYLLYNNPAATVDANDGALIWSVTKGIFTTNNPLFACGTSGVTRAELTSGAGPYALAEGSILTFDVDGVTKTVRFSNLYGDFVSIGAATSAEVVAYFNKQGNGRRTGLRAAQSTTSFKLIRQHAGATHDFQVAAGGANALFAFATTLNVGTGDTTFGLLSDAVTLRDPNAAPVIAPPGIPTVLYVDPDQGPQD